MFQAVIFDIGETLVGYDKPLNWSGLYRPALEHIADKCKLNFTEDDYQQAVDILTKYNTRINPREYEVSSAQIFEEMVSSLNLSVKNTDDMIEQFFSYFRRESFIYPEVEETLNQLLAKGIKTGTLSDVAYGMDNIYVFKDIETLKKYIDFPLTSNDVGYRKPCTRGVELLVQKMEVDVSECIFVGDEKKDMVCANAAGAYSVLINRSKETKRYGQAEEISSLLGVLDIIDSGNKNINCREIFCVLKR